MKHKLNLPEHPNIIFLIIVFDLFVLVAIYGLYGTNWVGQSGFKLDLPSSNQTYLPISPNHLLVKIYRQDRDTCIVGKKAVPLKDFETELTRQKEKFQVEEILLMVDKHALISREQEIISIIQGLGLKCTIVTQPKNAD